MLIKSLQSLQEVQDFVRGCTFFGTGGGGSPEHGVETLMSVIEKGMEVGWTDLSGLEDDDYTICPFLMGSIAPTTESALKEMKTLGLNKVVHGEKDTLAIAVSKLEKFTGKTAKALVPIELGGGNAPACIAAAAINGVAALDGDYSGRAIPEIQQTTPYIFEKTLLPITSCDAWGNTCIIDAAINWRIAERIGKLISDAGYSGYAATGQAGFLMSGRDTKEAIIPGTMTECYEIGRLIREKREAGLDPVAAVTEKLGGWVVCRGTVTGKEWEDRAGYYWGTHTITGCEEFAGTTLKIWFKNENHISWKNGEFFITSPDSLIVVNAENGEPYTNTKITKGQQVVVIGLKAKKVFRCERGIDVLGPRAFGFDIDYRPIETRI
jgi:Uncharacterized conserved protein